MELARFELLRLRRTLVLTSSHKSLLPLVTRSILYTSCRGFKRTETFQTGESLISVVTSRKEILVIAILLRHLERYFMLRLARHILYHKSPRARSPSERYEKRYVLADNLAAQRGYIREINLAGSGIRSDKYFTSERKCAFLLKIVVSCIPISPNRDNFQKLSHFFSQNGVYIRITLIFNHGTRALRVLLHRATACFIISERSKKLQRQGKKIINNIPFA